MKKYIRSPLNYTGGKYKLLDKLIPHFPSNINTFVDLFCGGCNVAINVNASKKICNDRLNQVIEIYNYFINSSENIFSDIDYIIKLNNLNSENKEEYIKFRSLYNFKDKNPLYLYVLICHSFSNQIRFNSKNEFNMPFGKRTFNDSLKSRLDIFIDSIKNIEFMSEDFEKVDLRFLTKDDFVYCDPPYLITSAPYNETSGGWKVSDELRLLNFLDNLNYKGIKFALSNVIENKGNKNVILEQWMKKYNVIYLDNNYNNCNYHIKNRNSKTVEVLITNYER